MQTPFSIERTLGGRSFRMETGRLAGQANGAVTVHYGDTVVLVTACMSPEPREGADFLPLTVDYEEKLYAAGKIPGGFFRREGRPTQEATLTMRLTDRSLRPLFPKGMRNEIQIVIVVLSADLENDPDMLAINGASAALAISDIPFGGPVGAVRVGYVNGEFSLNPTFTQLTRSSLDLVVAGNRDGVIMVEAGAQEVPEGVILEAIRFGQEVNGEIIALQEELAAAVGKAKTEVQLVETDPELEGELASMLNGRIGPCLEARDKASREDALERLRAEMVARLGERFTEKEIRSCFEARLSEEVRRNILERGQRPDGRQLTAVRPITCEVGALPRTHGSGLFTRGETQVLTIATLGSPGEEQIIDALTQEESKRFIHHYNFPPFSTGEVRRLGGPRRREVGHGALAERALLPMIPAEDDFPYTIRLVSEVLSSNGSTSMASVCGSSLSLMDAGVPIKSPVAGVAMGLVKGDDEHFAILTDIIGMEDALGDMDFKVAGTAEGITALQMDIKTAGISYQIMEQALAQAREGRLFILDKMLQTIDRARADLSPYAPRMIKINIDPDRIRYLIGPGGKTIRSLQDEYKVTIDVEADGTVLIGSVNQEMAKKAIQAIEGLTRDVEVGAIYTGRVTRLMNYGAFVEVVPGKEGLVHISELADYRVASVEDVVKVGDEITVMVTEIDRLGRINLSRRAVLQGLMNLGGSVKPELSEGPRRRRGPHGEGRRRSDDREERRPGGPLPRPRIGGRR